MHEEGAPRAPSPAIRGARSAATPTILPLVDAMTPIRLSRRPAHHLALCLALAPCLGLLLACDSDSPATPPEVEEPRGEDPELPGLLVDDFEDGDLDNQLGVTWHFYTDQDAAGASTITTEPAERVQSPGSDSDHALSFDFTFSRGDYAWDPFVGTGTSVPGDVEVGEYEGLSYSYKGAAHAVRFETSNVKDYDFYVMNVPAATEWTKVTVPFAATAQAGYGEEVEWDPALLTTINWHIVGADGASGSFALDDVRFETSAPVDRGPKNLTIHPAEPPEKVDLGDVTIDTPLQKKALAQLDRGYNITNWLEAGRFQSFDFDESYVEKLAQAGFKALRLPIDLDLYVTDVEGSGDDMTVTVHDDLWTILDSFDEWTAAHGLSYTIDYHQYDASFTFANEAGVDQAVALWRLVAQHFASSDRDDLYFELLNEPELSTGATSALTPSRWTRVAQRMIDAIRAENTKHTIIFGDVNWYGIDELAKRTPFEDDNIVYAFHTYEPFIFTHQGADWANMASIRDVPFPYTPERWSEYASDFGLTSAQPSWIWSQFQNYHINGTEEAVYNHIARAKQWSVEHQVPVICNEFGVFERRSQLEDRVAYYKHVIATFRELEIPWQLWFMVMDDEGTVIPEYVEAFGLEPL